MFRGIGGGGRSFVTNPLMLDHDSDLLARTA